MLLCELRQATNCLQAAENAPSFHLTFMGQLDNIIFEQAGVQALQYLVETTVQQVNDLLSVLVL